MKRSAFLLALMLAAPTAARAQPSWKTLSTASVARNYSTLWAVSDMHGNKALFANLLVKAGLVVATRDGALAWNPRASRQLLVTVGDYLNGGKESVGLVLWLKDLQAQAARAGSLIIVLLGNQEVEFLSDPEKNTTKDVLESSKLVAARLKQGDKVKPSELYDSEFGKYLRQLPAGATIGSWLFAHAGYLDVKLGDKVSGNDARKVRDFFTTLESAMSARKKKSYDSLMNKQSVVMFHNWWKDKKRLALMKAVLGLAGLNGLVIGHDPDALGALGTAAINREGWLMKVDTGIKDGQSRGFLLRCDVRSIARPSGLLMVVNGRPACSQLDSSGSLRALPVR